MGPGLGPLDPALNVWPEPFGQIVRSRCSFFGGIVVIRSGRGSSRNAPGSPSSREKNAPTSSSLQPNRSVSGGVEPQLWCWRFLLPSLAGLVHRLAHEPV